MPSVNLNPIINHLNVIPQIINQMWIIARKKLGCIIIYYKNRHLGLNLIHQGQNYFLTNTSTNGGVRYPIC